MSEKISLDSSEFGYVDEIRPFIARLLWREHATDTRLADGAVLRRQIVHVVQLFRGYDKKDNRRYCKQLYPSIYHPTGKKRTCHRWKHCTGSIRIRLRISPASKPDVQETDRNDTIGLLRKSAKIDLTLYNFYICMEYKAHFSLLCFFLYVPELK